MEALAFVLVAEASVGAIGRNAAEAQMGGSLAPTALGYSIECSFFAPKAETVEDPNASRQAPYSTKEVMKCPFVAAVGNCRATKSFHPFFIPKNDTHLD